MEAELRRKIGQDLSEKFQRRFERKLEDELRKIDRNDETWRAKLESEERRYQELADSLAKCRRECSRVSAASQKKDAAAAELALLVSEKDMLLTELALLSRAQKRELERLSHEHALGAAAAAASKVSYAGTESPVVGARAKTIRTQLKESLFGPRQHGSGDNE